MHLFGYAALLIPAIEEVGLPIKLIIQAKRVDRGHLGMIIYNKNKMRERAITQEWQLCALSGDTNLYEDILDEQDSDGYSLAHYLAEVGDLESLKWLAEKHPDHLHKKTAKGATIAELAWHDEPILSWLKSNFPDLAICENPPTSKKTPPKIKSCSYVVTGEFNPDCTKSSNYRRAVASRVEIPAQASTAEQEVLQKLNSVGISKYLLEISRVSKESYHTIWLNWLNMASHINISQPWQIQILSNEEHFYKRLRNLYDNEGWSAVHYFAKIGNIKGLQWLQENYEIGLEAHTSRGETVGTFAGYDINVLKWVNQNMPEYLAKTDDRGYNTAHHMATRGNQECWNFLLATQPQIMLALTEDGKNVLEIAQYSLSSSSESTQASVDWFCALLKKEQPTTTEEKLIIHLLKSPESIRALQDSKNIPIGKIIYKYLINHENYSLKELEQLSVYKEEIVKYIKTLPEAKRREACELSFDKNTPIGELFRIQRGWLPTSENTGTLLTLKQLNTQALISELKTTNHLQIGKRVFTYLQAHDRFTLKELEQLSVYKEPILDYIKTLPENKQREACQLCLNKRTPLGELFRIQRGWLPTRKTAGTLLTIKQMYQELTHKFIMSYVPCSFFSEQPLRSPEPSSPSLDSEYLQNHIIIPRK